MRNRGRRTRTKSRGWRRTRTRTKGVEEEVEHEEDVGEEVARGMYAEHLYLERFNLETSDVAAGADLDDGRPPAPERRTASKAFMTYFRMALRPRRFYNVDSLRPSQFFYVMERKVLAGRDKEWHEDDAVGRVLSIVFYEREPGGDPEAPVVTRCDSEGFSLAPVPCTLAELIKALGYKEGGKEEEQEL